MSKYLYFLGFLLIGCGPGAGNKVYNNLEDNEKIKFEKYLIQGKAIYREGCINCHQGNGRGLRKLIPPLANSDYLINNQVNVVCLIKNGAHASIMVNGIDYPATMPAHADLTNLEIAEVLTYINNSWGNEIGFVEAKEVSDWLKQCEN